ncbi:hypothetical protein ACRAWB_01835 [Leifsonia poae]|uniref:hypothetical protein n=1 Tax=Leifsonia poae TaxID=110933 RepID=UPI003D681B39
MTDEFACLILFLADTDASSVTLAGVISPTVDTDSAIERLANVRPLSWWKQHAIVGLTSSEGYLPPEDVRPLLGAIFDLDAEEVHREAESIARAKMRHPSQEVRERRRMSDALSAEIAEVYRDAWTAGKNPTQAVAHHFNKPYSTAARWVGEARKRGHLGPADGSRGGETTSPESTGD